jgi:molecular chaperone IbpA
MPEYNYRSNEWAKMPAQVESLFKQIGGCNHPIYDTSLLDSLLSRLGNKQSYPPYDIISNICELTHSYKMSVKMALAGFDKEDISIEVKSNVLTISSPGKSEETIKYIHKGISQRAFETKFKLAPHAVVKGAVMAEGILEVVIEFIILADEKSNKIVIK